MFTAVDQGHHCRKVNCTQPVLVHIRWQGGACTEPIVQLPPDIANYVRYLAAVVERVRELAQGLPDAEIGRKVVDKFS